MAAPCLWQAYGAGLLVAAAAAAVAACGGPSAVAGSSRAAIERSPLEALRSTPLDPWPREAVHSAVYAVEPGGEEPALRRHLLRDQVVAPRFVAATRLHPAAATIRARAEALRLEGVDARRLPLQAFDDAVEALAPHQQAVRSAQTVDAARTARQRVRAAGVAVEARAWHLAFAVARALGGPLADTRGLDAYAERLHDEPRLALLALEPKAPEYLVASRALPRYEALAGAEAPSPWKAGGVKTKRWRRWKVGRDHPAAEPLRARLEFEGFAATPDPRPDGTAGGLARVDDALTAALRRFQSHAGVPQTGKPDAATRAALDVPMSERVTQLKAALEHMRTNPARRSPYRIQVNIAGYELSLWRGGAVARRHRVIVGSNAHGSDPWKRRSGPINRTPALEAMVSELVINPSWWVPRRIKEFELDPRAARNPRTYRTFDVFTDDSGIERAVQRPGANNALGRVKFVLPRSDGIYLHDTPQPELFDRVERALSHGCVRVEDAWELAQALLRDDSRPLPPGTAERLLASGHETQVLLSRPVPLYLEYVTVGASEAGELRFFPDIYDWGDAVPASPPDPFRR